MTIRNFWIDATIDGRKTKLAGGPQRKDGGFRLEVKVREDGRSVLPLVIVGTEVDGQLELQVDMSKDFQPDTQDRFARAIQVFKSKR